MIINMNGAKAPETPSSVLQEKTVTPETLPTVIGPDEGYDGLTQVTVNPDAQLKAENIRSGKTIFGVEGVFGGSASDSLLPKILSTKVLDRSDPFEGYDVHLSDFDELAFNGIVPYYEYNSSRIKYLEVPSDNITFQDSCFLGLNSGYYTSGGYSAPKSISLYFCGPNLPRRTNTFASYTLVSCCIESFPTSYLTNVSTVIKKYTMSLTCYGDVIEIPEGITGVEVNGCPITFVNLNSFSFDVKGGTVILPSTLTSLYSTQAVIYRGCMKLSTLKIKATTPPVLSYSANDTSYKPSKIIVPIGTLEAYQTATNWSVYADVMEEATE